MPDFQKMFDAISDHDMVCEVCIYQGMGCTGGVSGGPNGPIFPPCSDLEPQRYVDEELMQDVYDEIMEADNRTGDEPHGKEPV